MKNKRFEECKSKFMIKGFLLTAFFIFSFIKLSADESGTIVPRSEIGVDEHLDQLFPDSVFVRNEKNEVVDLISLINKPTVINFVYFRCPGICTPVMDGIADLVNKTDLKIGVDYQVLTISFDPRETFDLAVKKKNNYMALLNKEDARNGWLFFVSDSASIAKATDAVGFRYKRNGNDFLHAAAIAVLSPDGRITRYHYGTFYQPFEFKMSIVEALEGKSAPTINRLLKFCYSYDPQGKQYVLNVTKVTGSLIIFLALALFLILALKPLFKRKITKT